MTFAARAAEGQRMEDLIGHTPLLSFRNVTAHLPASIEVLAKAEWTNPGGSVKDRAALNMILTAEETAYGVDVVLTNPEEGSDGAIRAVRAQAAAEPDKYFYVNRQPAVVVTIFPDNAYKYLSEPFWRR